MTFEVPALAAGFASKFDTIGPYVGFGSLIAVVAMAVLVFSQGRELQRLREWAGTAPERLDELEQRFEEDLRRPRGQTLAPHPGGQPQRGPVPPGGPVGLTRPAGPGAQRPPAVGASMAAGAAVGASAVGAASAAGATPKPTPKPTPPGGYDTDDGSGGQPTRVVPATAAGAQRAVASGPRAASAAGIAAKTARERETAAASGSRRTPGQILGVAVVLIVVLIGVLFALGVFGSSETPTAKQNAVDQKAQKRQSHAKPYSPTATSVVVLNSSPTPRLAKAASGILDEKRFNTGPAGDYTENGVKTAQQLSTIAYRAGRGNREAAVDIAKALKLPVARVKPMTANVRMATSGSPKIIVILGMDYAAKQADGVAPADTATTPPADQQSSPGTDGTTGSGGTSGAAGTTGGAATGAGTGAASGATDTTTGGTTGDTTGGAATTGSGGTTTP